jgi:hypothetical protein
MSAFSQVVPAAGSNAAGKENGMALAAGAGLTLKRP